MLDQVLIVEPAALFDAQVPDDSNARVNSIDGKAEGTVSILNGSVDIRRTRNMFNEWGDVAD